VARERFEELEERLKQSEESQMIMKEYLKITTVQTAGNKP